MPLPLIVSCFSKIQIGFTFLEPAHPGSPGQRAVKHLCVCVAEYHLCWQNMTYIGRTWFILAEYNFYWQNITSIGRIRLLPAEYDFHWQIWFILAYCHSYWLNMQPIKSVLLCSADSIYPCMVTWRCDIGHISHRRPPTRLTFDNDKCHMTALRSISEAAHSWLYDKSKLLILS